jgi:hypothetical protein
MEPPDHKQASRYPCCAMGLERIFVAFAIAGGASSIALMIMLLWVH